MAMTKTKSVSGYNKYKPRYTTSFKWKVCQEYLKSTETKASIQRRNGIQGQTAIVIWLRQFGLKDKITSLSLGEQLILQMPESKPEKVQFQELEIDRLKKELAEANLRVEAYQKMIEIAEQEFRIEIKKKYVAKQSMPSNQPDQQ